MPAARALHVRSLLLVAVLGILAVAGSRLRERSPATQGGPRDACVAAPPTRPAPTLRGTRTATLDGTPLKDTAVPSPPDDATDAGVLQAWGPSKVTIRDGETGAVLDAPWDTDIWVGQGCFRVNVDVDPPPGYVQWERRGWSWAGWISNDPPVVKRYEVVIPLRRMVPVWITLRREDGQGLQDAKLAWRLESGPWKKVAPEGEVTRVHGVPHFGGRRLQVRATDGAAEGYASARLPVAWQTPVDVEVRLCEPEAAGIDVEVETDEDLPYEESLGDDAPPDPKTASLRVHVTRRNGSPAADVPIWMDQDGSQTDANGFARFTGLDAGNHVLRIPGSWGLPPMGRTVTLKEGEARELAWRETEGAVLEVTVVDGKGHGLPFATIAIRQASGVPWVDQDGDLQRMDPFTDERGERRFDHVEKGRVRVRATWGGRSTLQRVDVREGETLPVRLVIR